MAYALFAEDVNAIVDRSGVTGFLCLVIFLPNLPKIGGSLQEDGVFNACECDN
jgi:hypothetical protein